MKRRVFNDQADQQSPPCSGERRLWLAVVEEAFADLASLRADHPLIRAQAEDAFAWITSESDRPRSFRWACAQLGLDPEYWRQGIEVAKRGGYSREGGVSRRA